MKLDEKDIKAVARFRFVNKRRWWMLGSLALLTGGLIAALPLGESVWFVVAGGAAVLYIGGLGWLWKQQVKWERRLVDEWKKNSLGS